jgi:hypothetical protein
MLRRSEPSRKLLEEASATIDPSSYWALYQVLEYFFPTLGHYEVLYKLRVEAGVHALAVLDTWGKDQRELLVQAGVHYLIERVEQIRDIWFVQARVLSASGT